MKSFWKSHFLTLILVAADLIAFSILWTESWQLRHALNARFSEPINDFEAYREILPRFLVLWVAIMVYFDHYAHRGKISSLNQAGNIFKAGLGIWVGTMAMAFLFKNYDVGRSVIFISTGVMTLYIYASRTALRMTKQFFLARGHGLTRVIIIGAGKTGRAVAARMKNHPEVGYELVGFVDDDPELLDEVVDDIPVIGSSKDLLNLLLRHRVDEVFLAVPSLSTDDKFNMMTECEQAKVHFKLVSDDLLTVITDKVKIDDIGDFSVILFRDGHLSPIEMLLKRMLDLAVSIPAMILALPLMGLIALAIRSDSPGPAVFVQDRVGRDGKRFKMYKFRTMKADAEAYAEAPNDPKDARVTRIGAFLRKTSFDEIPQLLNVLIGNMSLVGPRPEMPFIVEKYDVWQRRRLDVLPGITGLWQIAGRKQLPLHLNLEYDFYYIRNWSLILDLVILFRTAPAVLFGRGAF